MRVCVCVDLAPGDDGVKKGGMERFPTHSYGGISAAVAMHISPQPKRHKTKNTCDRSDERQRRLQRNLWTNRTTATHACAGQTCAVRHVTALLQLTTRLRCTARLTQRGVVEGEVSQVPGVLRQGEEAPGVAVPHQAAPGAVLQHAVLDDLHQDTERNTC